MAAATRPSSANVHSSVVNRLADKQGIDKGATRASDDIAELLSASPSQRLKFLELASTLAQTKFPPGKSFEEAYNVGKLSEFLATCDRFFLAGIGPVQSKTIMFNRKYRPVTRSASQQSSAEAVVTHPPVQVTAPVPDSVQEDDSPGNAAGSPSAEIKFAGFLCSLVSRQAFINGEAANFLKQNKLLPPGTTAMTWIQQRGCLFRVVDQQWVAMQRLHPGEGKEVFLDRVLTGFMIFCGKPLHKGSVLGVLCKHLGIDMQGQFSGFFQARSGKYCSQGHYMGLRPSFKQQLRADKQAASGSQTPTQSPTSVDHSQHLRDASSVISQALGLPPPGLQGQCQKELKLPSKPPADTPAAPAPAPAAAATAATAAVAPHSDGELPDQPMLERVLPADAAAKQDIAALADENADIQLQMAQLRSDQENLRQEMEAVKQQLSSGQASMQQDLEAVRAQLSEQGRMRQELEAVKAQLASQATMRQDLEAIRAQISDQGVMRQDLESLRAQLATPPAPAPTFGSMQPPERTASFFSRFAAPNGSMPEQHGMPVPVPIPALPNGHAPRSPAPPMNALEHFMPPTNFEQPSQLQQQPSGAASHASNRQQHGFVIVGGHDGSWLSTCQSCIAGASGKEWGHLPDLPKPHAFAAASSVGPLIYVLGGGTGIEWYDSTYMYKMGQDRTHDWLPAAPMLHKRGNHAALTMHGQIFCMGGGRGGEHTTLAEVYDTDSDRWTAIKSMTSRRSSHSAAVHGGAIYAVGGYNGDKYLATAERYDPREGRWEELPDRMTTQRGSLGVAAGPGGIFAVGGFDSKRSLDSFEVLDPAMNIWRLNPSCMNAQRVAVSAVGVEDEVWAVGGVKGGLPSHDIPIECWYASREGWTPISTPSHVNFQRSFAAACAFSM